MAEYDKESEDLSEEDARVSSVRKKWKEAKEGISQWRDEARTAYAFRAGDQWSQEDKAKLEEEGRPSTTFNRTEVMVEAVAGLEVNNRQSVRYFPREIGDVKPNEILTATADWIRDQCGAEDEESEAFKDAATCGIGCTETRMDYDEDPDGKVLDERRDPLMMFPDPHSSKRGFRDAKYVFHAQWLDKTELEARWPGKEIAWQDDDLGSQTPGDGDKSFEYDGDNPDVDVQEDKALVLHYQCWKLEPYYRLFDPFQQKNVELSEEDFKNLEKNGKKAGMSFARADSAGEDDIAYVKQNKKVYYRGFFCGGTELEYGRSPIQSGFTFKFITAKRDRNKKCWYGIVRVLMDPQKWANKWMSQILHIVNSNAKGGAFVEENALVDKRKAEDQWAQAAPLILLTEGAIDKIKERTPASYPQGLDRLMTFAFESMPFVSGINLEMLGLAGREQAGVLEAQRRKSAMAILAPLFASNREFKKEKGRMYLEFIEKFIPEGKIVRIVGEKATQFAKFVKSPDIQEHDVVIDESPDSPDFREQAWAGLNEVLPALIKQGVKIPAEVLKYAPLPSEVAEALTNAMAGAQQLPPEVQQQMKQMEAALQKAGEDLKKLTEENQQLKVDQTVEMAKLQQKAAADRMKQTDKMKEVQMEVAVKQFEAILDAKVSMYEARLKAQVEAQTAKMDAAAKVTSEGMKVKEQAKAKSEEKPQKVKIEVGKPDEEVIGAIGEMSKTLTSELRKISEKKPKKRKVKTPEGRVYTVEEE